MIKKQRKFVYTKIAHFKTTNKIVLKILLKKSSLNCKVISGKYILCLNNIFDCISSCPIIMFILLQTLKCLPIIRITINRRSKTIVEDRDATLK